MAIVSRQRNSWEENARLKHGKISYMSQSSKRVKALAFIDPYLTNEPKN
jgi:hypothetical protein